MYNLTGNAGDTIVGWSTDHKEKPEPHYQGLYS